MNSITTRQIAPNAHWRNVSRSTTLGMRGVELFVNIEPVADGDPTQRRENQQERGHRKVDIEILFQMQPHTRLVSGYKGNGSKQNVSGPEDGLDFSIVPAEHFGLSIT